MKLNNPYYKLNTLIYSLIFLTLISCNVDQHISPPEVELSESDEIFISKATYVNLIGIEYARMAEMNSSNGLILAYADRMIEEYTEAASYLETIAEDFEVATPDIILSDKQADIDQLSELSDKEFDSLYIQKNIETHLWAQEVMEEQISVSDVEALINYSYQQLTEINLRLNDALIIQSELH